MNAPPLGTRPGATSSLVSVVMPAYNATRFIREAIASVQCQTHDHWELLVVDDGSSDDTAAVIGELARDDPRIRTLSHTVRAGVAAARNTALDAARGEWVAFLDSDDTWLPDKLSLQLDAMVTHGWRISYGEYLRQDTEGRPLGHVRPAQTASFHDMLWRNHVGHLTGMYLRAPLADLRFVPVGHEDHVFWVSAIRRLGSAHLAAPGNPLGVYRVHRHSLSANKWRAATWQWRNYRRQFGLGLLPSACYLGAYACSALWSRARPW